MSVRFCSTGPPRMPDPTMLRNASTRVRERSITCSLKRGNERHPAAADVDERRLAGAERVTVGLHGAVAVAVLRLVVVPPEDVRVNVDEPGHDVEARRVGDACARARRDVGRHQRDLAGGDRDVHDRVDAVARIDDVAVLDEEVELGYLRLKRRRLTIATPDDEAATAATRDASRPSPFCSSTWRRRRATILLVAGLHHPHADDHSVVLGAGANRRLAVSRA